MLWHNGICPSIPSGQYNFGTVEEQEPKGRSISVFLTTWVITPTSLLIGHPLFVWSMNSTFGQSVHIVPFSVTDWSWLPYNSQQNCTVYTQMKGNLATAEAQKSKSKKSFCTTFDFNHKIAILHAGSLWKKQNKKTTAFWSAREVCRERNWGIAKGKYSMESEREEAEEIVE